MAVKTPFIGPSYTLASVNMDCQDSINLFPVKSESNTSKNIDALQGTPGNILFCTVPTNAGRGSRNVLGRAFAVFGNTLYEIFSDGSYVSRGTLDTSTFFVSMSDNGQQLCIVDGPNGYIFTLATNAFQKITDPYFLGAATVTFIDGYFMYNKPDTSGIYYISALYDGLTGDPLDFATAEGSPDGLVGIVTVHRQVFLIGTQSVEVVYNSGDADFPFARIDGAFIEYGCIAPYSIARTANAVFWLGRDQDGQATVWMATGYQPQRVSTFATETAFQNYGDISDAIAFTYQENGQYFYGINFTNANISWFYDINLGLWHKRASFVNGQYQRARAQTHMFVFNKHLVTDYQNGNVYNQSLNFYQDNGQPIRRLRASPHNATDLNYNYFSSFQLDMETGVGLNDGSITDTDPKVALQWSDDGGHTWSDEHWKSFGKIGQYSARALWRRLGRSRDRVWRTIITASCKVYLIQALVNVQAGRN